MVEPTIIVAIITAASLIYTTTAKVVSDQLGNRKNANKSKENALSAQSVSTAVSSNNIEKISEKEKDLRRRQREFQSDITFFGAQITRAYSDEELNTLASIGALGEVLKGNGSLTRDARALQSTIASLLEMSSNSESNRMKSLFQVKVCAIPYGLSFPMMAYYLLHFIDFRRKRFAY